MTLPKKLEAMRDSLAENYRDLRGGAEDRIFKNGFDAASAIYHPVVMELIEASQHLLNNFVSQRDIATSNGLRNVHLEHERFVKLADGLTSAREKLGL